MRLLHCVTDEKFIDGAIALYDEDPRVENIWVHFVKENLVSLNYIKSPKVKILNIDKFDELIKDVDVIVLHSLPALCVEKIISIPDRVKIIWYAWGYDLYDGGNPLIPLRLYLPETLKIYNGLTKSPTIFKAIKRSIEKFLRAKKNEYAFVLPKVDYFSGVFPYEYSIVKNRYPEFRASSVDFYYASPQFFIKDILPTDVSNELCNIMIGNSANITNNHADALNFVSKYVSLSKSDKVIIPLSYGGTKEYVNIVKDVSYKLLGDKVNVLPLDKYLPADEYWCLTSNCRIAIYSHVRQQASDNIFYQIMIGAKVYFTIRSEAFSFLKSIGLKVFSMEEDYSVVNTPLTYDEIMHNRMILTKYYSVSTHVNRVKKINTQLLEG